MAASSRRQRVLYFLAIDSQHYSNFRTMRGHTENQRRICLLMNRVLLVAILIAEIAMAQNATLTNPLLPSGPDPWVITRNGFYYYMHTTGKNLTIWRTRHIAQLATAEKKVIWTPPATGPYSHDIWAPELHYFQGKWYLYFSADAGSNQSHRIWVLENASTDPFDGEWTFKGKISDASDHWAIDGSVFEVANRLYLIWSGWEDDVNGVQNIYIAGMKNPWTVDTARARISTPSYSWEKIGDLPPNERSEVNHGLDARQPVHVDVNEGPELLQHGGKLFLLYSAGGCWTDYYTLGMLTASAGSGFAGCTKSWSEVADSGVLGVAFGECVRDRA